jgi:hypothetical protein
LDDDGIGFEESFSTGRAYQSVTSSDNAVYTKNLTRALQLQKGLFVLENSMITYENAKEFMEQATCQGDAIQLVKKRSTPWTPAS